MTKVIINQLAINRFFQRSPFAGAGVPGLKSGTADRIAARMLIFVQAEARSQFHVRTGDLVESLRPIIRIDSSTGRTEVGVGSVVEHASYLENGTSPHPIPLSPFIGGGRYLISNGPRSKGPNPTPLEGRRLFVHHPGNRAFGFIRRGVNRAIGRPI